jgi:hypothetical protein
LVLVAGTGSWASAGAARPANAATIAAERTVIDMTCSFKAMLIRPGYPPKREGEPARESCATNRHIGGFLLDGPRTTD